MWYGFCVNSIVTRHPLTIDQATSICSDFQYLIGRKFSNKDIFATIACVVVVPYDEVNKYIFLLEYRNCQDAVQALDMYDGASYDVVILGKIQSDKTQYVCKELDTYLSENNILFTIEDYVS
jgi:hypothetical protein